jgi:hypothetical protein
MIFVLPLGGRNVTFSFMNWTYKEGCGASSMLNEYCAKNTSDESFHVLILLGSSDVNHLRVEPVKPF